MGVIVSAQPGFFIVTAADDAVSGLVRDPVIAWDLSSSEARPVGLHPLPEWDRFIIQQPADPTYQWDEAAAVEFFKARVAAISAWSAYTKREFDPKPVDPVVEVKP